MINYVLETYFNVLRTYFYDTVVHYLCGKIPVAASTCQELLSCLLC
jgi:hypothetical protein